MKKKTIALVIASMLVFGIVAGATVAWLQDKTATVENTFTVGDIDIKLTESELAADGKTINPASQVTQQANKYKVVPGSDITKDPRITFEKDSEACWLFVKVEKSENWADTGMTFSIEEGWTELTSGSGIYYRKLSADQAKKNQEYYILADNKITVPDTLVKDNLTAASTASLKFTAYAIQSDNLDTAQAAWDEVN